MRDDAVHPRLKCRWALFSSCKMARRQSKDSTFVRFVDVVFYCSIVHRARFFVALCSVLGLFIITARKPSSGKEAFKSQEP
jgi:hypothetical protein